MLRCKILIRIIKVTLSTQGVATLRNKQKIIDSILADMREHFKDAKKYMKKGNHNMIVAGFKSARECRDQLYEYMTTEEARHLYIAAYEKIFEVKND